MTLPLVLLNRRRIGGFSPRAIIAGSTALLWLDPSDLTTLFQDTAGTQPVTTPGQTVALALDKSQGLVLGSELRGTGTTGLIGTATAATYNTSTGVGSVTRVDLSNQSFVQIAGLTNERSYLVNITCSSGTLAVRSGSFSGNLVSNVSSGQTLSIYVTASSASMTITNTTSAGTATFILNSVKELPGFHATQATAASRPTYGVVPQGGRRNLLTYTEDLTNGVWTAINGTTKNSALSFTFTATNSRIYQSFALASGATYTLSVRFSDTDVGKKIRPTFFDSVTGWSLLADTTIPVGGVVTRTFTMSNAGTFVGFQAASDLSANTSFTLVAGQSVQLEVGSTSTAYQEVVSQYNVTEAGVPSLSYLSFDGVDDFLVTPTITPGVDKAQVFAGVRHLSNANYGAMVSFGTTVADPGSLLTWLRSSGGGGQFEAYAKGSSSATTGTVTGTAALTVPATSVFSTLYDIAQSSVADEIRVRQNGAAMSVAGVSSAGTGNFSAWPMNIGQYNGTHRLNANIFSLIVRFGANLDAATIAATETWVNSKTGAY